MICKKLFNKICIIFLVASSTTRGLNLQIFNNEIWTPISTKSFKSLKKNSSRPFSHHTIQISVYR